MWVSDTVLAAQVGGGWFLARVVTMAATQSGAITLLGWFGDAISEARRGCARAGALLAAGLAVLCLCAMTESHGALPCFTEVPVTTLTFGQDVDQIAVAECEDGDTDACSLLAFLGQGDDVYVLDRPVNTLKRLRFDNASPVITAVAGPAPNARDELPHDGCVGPDGTVYLLADGATVEERIIIYARPSKATTWTRAEPLNDGAVGWKTVEGQHIPVYGSARIGVEPDGSVTVFDQDRWKSEAVVVAEAGRLLKTAERRCLARGLTLASGVLAGRSDTSISLSSLRGGDVGTIKIRGELLGMDATGNTYMLTYLPDEEYALQRFDSRGRLTASSPFPLRSSIRGIVGNSLMAAANGGVYKFRVTQLGLVITRWAVTE
jgi:hypothetical protein